MMYEPWLLSMKYLFALVDVGLFKCDCWNLKTLKKTQNYLTLELEYVNESGCIVW